MNWISIDEEEAPLATKLLVVKSYMVDETVISDSLIQVDISFSKGIWYLGGFVTHWMPLPFLPKE